MAPLLHNSVLPILEKRGQILNMLTFPILLHNKLLIRKLTTMMRQFPFLFFKFSKRASKFDPSKDYYKILDVNPFSSKNTIRTAYLRLAKKYHPDINPEGKEKFSSIQEAYSILSDDEKKQQYDEWYDNQKSVKKEENKEKKHEQFKGQRSKPNTYRSHDDWEQLIKQREKWKQEYYAEFGGQNSTPSPDYKKKGKPKKERTQLDEQYNKMQYNFSNRNPFNNPFTKAEKKEEQSVVSYWAKLKNLFKF